MDLGGPCDSAGCDRPALVELDRRELCRTCFEIELALAHDRLEDALRVLLEPAPETRYAAIRSPLLYGDDE